MLIREKIEELKKECMYNNYIYDNMGLINDIFQKVYNINLLEDEKKKKYRNFFLKQKINIIDNKTQKYKIPIYLSQYKYKKLYVDKKKKYRDLATGRRIIDNLTENEINNLDNILEKANTKIYQTSWTKLGQSLKINRIYYFIESLSKQYNLDKEYTTKLQDELLNAIKTKKITKSDQVDYDIENGKIINIHILKYNQSLNTFSLN